MKTAMLDCPTLDFPQTTLGMHAGDLVLTAAGEDGPGRRQTRGAVEVLTKRAVSGETFDGNLTKRLDGIIAELEEKLSGQLDAIMHDPKLLSLEGRWRGLVRNVENAKTNDDFEHAVLDVSIDDVRQDMDQAAGDVLQSRLFEVLVRDQYLVLGGRPFNAVTVDWEATASARDARLLDFMGRVGAHGHSVFITGYAPQFLGVESWDEAPRHPDAIKELLSRADLGAYRAFRDEEHAKYVALAGPPVMVRGAYHPTENPAKGAEHYRERIASPADCVWANAAYGVGECVGRSFSQYGWPGATVGVNTGGRIEALASVRLDRNEQWPTRLYIDEPVEPVLADFGLISITPDKANRSVAVIFAMPTTYRPQESTDAKSTADNRLAAKLMPVLAGSRFCHFTKVLMREMIGGMFEADEIREHLTDFLQQYVLPDPKQARSEPSLKYKHPLKNALVKSVAPVPGRPGTFMAVVEVAPHLNMEAITVALRVVSGVEGKKA